MTKISNVKSLLSEICFLKALWHFSSNCSIRWAWQVSWNHFWEMALWCSTHSVFMFMPTVSDFLPVLRTRWQLMLFWMKHQKVENLVITCKPTHSRGFLYLYDFLHCRIMVKTWQLWNNTWNHFIIKKVLNKSKSILYLRFFKVATICLDDSFAHFWHSLNQLHEIFTWNAFKLTSVPFKT